MLADETRDVGNREQRIICIGWVSEMHEINGDTNEFIQLDNTPAETI